jgi:DNA-binding PucR family transcriptional regulator
VFDASPVPVIVASARDVMPPVAAAILGPLLQARPDDRAVLLETLEAWRDNDGSANAAGAALFCHPNTVRHRLRRIETLTGKSLTNPLAIAELCLALEAVRSQPALIS